MQRLAKWAFYWMLALISVVFAESFSGSTPIIMADPMVWFFYGLHYFILLDFLARRHAITWSTLIVAGLVLGFTTESILTKVIWNPPREQSEETLRILGLGVFEVGFTVTVWHVWMSTVLPIALTLHLFGLAEMFNAQQLRRFLRWLPASAWLMASFGVLDPFKFLLWTAANGAMILIMIFIYRLLPPLTSIQSLILARWERWLILFLLVVFYIVGWFEFRPEAVPSAGPFSLGMSLVVASIILLFVVRRRYTGLTPHGLPPSFTYGKWVKYMLYFTFVGVVVSAIGFVTSPVSVIFTLLGILIVSLRSNWHLFRLAFRHQANEPPPPAFMPPYVENSLT